MLDYNDSDMVDDVAKAVGKATFVGIFNCISNEASYKLTLSILEKLGGGRMATSQPPPDGLPDNVIATGVMGPGDHSASVWQNFVTKALESGQLKCLPEPLVVGKSLESLQGALDRAKAGVSAQKVIVEL